MTCGTDRLGRGVGQRLGEPVQLGRPLGGLAAEVGVGG